MLRVMISLGVILVLIGYGLAVGSFYYRGTYFSDVGAMRMLVAGIGCALHGWVVVCLWLINRIDLKHDIRTVRLVGDYPAYREP
jgi:hypothetical protein